MNKFGYIRNYCKMFAKIISYKSVRHYIFNIKEEEEKKGKKSIKWGWKQKENVM